MNFNGFRYRVACGEKALDGSLMEVATVRPGDPVIVFHPDCPFYRDLAGIEKMEDRMKRLMDSLPITKPVEEE